MAIKIENGKIIETNILGQQKVVGTLAEPPKEVTPGEAIKNTMAELLKPLEEAAQQALHNQQVLYDQLMKLAAQTMPAFKEEEERVKESTKKKK